jgi:DNA-binding transcriptional LysR family regulator
MRSRTTLSTWPLVTLPAKRRALALREVLEDPLVAVFPPSTHVPREALRPRFFTGRPLILYQRQGAIRTVIDRWFQAAGVRVTPAMELGSVEAARSFVAAGLGCSILPSIAVAGRRGLPVRELAPALSRKLGLACRQDKVLDAALRATLKAFERLGRR